MSYLCKKKFDHEFDFTNGVIKAHAIDVCKNPFSQEKYDLCMNSCAVLFGAIGNSKYDNDTKAKFIPEQRLLKMRKELGLHANL